MAVAFATEKVQLNDVQIIGGGSADPNTGAGVAAPRGSRYLSSSGRQFIKQTSADTGWRQLLIRGLYFNVVDYGAVGDDVTDNRVAINAAISAASAAGGGIVFFPPGRYAVYKTGAGAIASFDLNGSAYNNIMFLGCGGSSIVHMSGNAFSGDWYLFYVRGTVKHITFKNMAFDGAGITNPDPAEQNHAIQVSNLLTDNAYTGHVRVLDCRFYRFAGDGVRALGNGATRLVKDVLIRRGEFTMRDPVSGLGSRSGIGYQRGTYGVNAINCYLTGSDDQEIDMESTSTVAMGQHCIDGNHCDHDSNGTASVTLTGTGIGRHARSVVSRNTILNGGIQGLNVQQTVICNNFVVLDNHPAGSGAALSLQERIVSDIIEGNQLYAGPNMLVTTRAMTITAGTGGDNHLTTVASNMMISEISEGNCANFESQNELLIRDNMVRTSHVSGGGGDANMTVRAVGDAGRAQSVIGCMVRDTTASRLYCTMFSAAPSNMGAILADDMMVIGGTNGGIIFSAGGGGTFTGPVAGRGNLAAGTYTNPVVYTGGNAIATVDGNGGAFPQGVMQVLATPEAAANAMPGSIAGRNTGSGDGLTLYVKNDGSIDNTGWANVGCAEFVFGAADLTTGTGSLYLAPGSIPVASATQFTIVAARDLRIRAVRIKQIAGTGGGNTTYTVMRNTSTTSLSTTVAFTATTGSINTNIDVAAGERISVRTTKSVAPGTAPTFAVVTIEYFFRS